MSRPKDISAVPFPGNFSAGQKRVAFWFCAFWLAVALLELSQDYLSALLNENAFRLGESLAYKGFWLLFIPSTLLLDAAVRRTGKRLTGAWYFLSIGFLAVSLAFVHLLVFSFFLFGVSVIIHSDPWTIPFLIAEKLSTRLYLALSIYGALSAGLYLYYKRRHNRAAIPQERPATITVKNGKRSIIVKTDEIRWIGSDGPYLDIHTAGKKHVVLESLKQIITTLPDNFRRIHRSTIVNIDRIRELKSRGNGDYDVIMDDGSELRLSRNYLSSLKGELL